MTSLYDNPTMATHPHGGGAANGGAAAHIHGEPVSAGRGPAAEGPKKDPPPPEPHAGAAAITAASAAAGGGASHGKRSKRSRRGRHNKKQDADAATGRQLLYRDSVLVEILLDRTVDLSSIVATCRDRTLGRIYERYPQLNTKNHHNSSSTLLGAGNPRSSPARDGSDDDDDEAVEEGTSEQGKRRKPPKNAGAAASASGGANAGEKSEEDGGKKDSPSAKKQVRPPVMQHVPQKEDYGSMIEYLEAKYVQGVMLPDKGAIDEEGASDEGAGSVYSNDSFFDDTDLQRGVAGQVLAHSTTTRVELQASSSKNDGNDDDFFVNVGNLEVEETEYTKEHYDPLHDVDPKKAAKKASAASKKRKKPDAQDDGPSVLDSSATAGGGATSSSSVASKKAKKAKPAPNDENNNAKPSQKGAAKDSKKSAANGSLPSKASARALTSPPSAAESAAPAKDASPPANGAGSPSLKAFADEKKEIVDDLYRRLVELIPSETFPTRRGKVKVSLTCPADKKAGDFIQFNNPHVPGQRLRVQIPKSAQPGRPFKVHVPGEGVPDPATDYNKLSRDFHSLIDEYARAFDDWCDALGLYRKSVDESDCSAHFEKRTKFDPLVGEFPTNLKTPVDKAYLQKILRRARQNRSKRENNAKLKDETKTDGEAPASASASVTSSPAGSTKSEPKKAAAQSPASAIHAKAQEMIRRHSLSSSMVATSKEPPSKVGPAHDGPQAVKSGKPEANRSNGKPMGVPKLFHEFMRKKFVESDFAS